MARLWSSGFELNSFVAGVEFTGISAPGGTATRSTSTTIVRSGVFSGRFENTSVSPTAGQSFARHDFLNADGNGPYYVRVYFYAAAWPAVADSIVYLANATGGSRAVFKVSSTGSLGFYTGGSVLVGSAVTLTLNRWYRLEMSASYDGSATMSLEGRVDGITIGSTVTANGAGGMSRLYFGSVTSTTGFDFYMDDIAVNDANGTVQNSWCGPGQIVHLNPNANGDNNAWLTQIGGTAGAANNFTRVNEVPPNDVSSYNASNIATQIDDYNLIDYPGSASDTISVVAVGVRYRGAAASANATFTVRCKASSGGAIEESAGITPTSTGWQTNAGTVSKPFPIVLYDLPGVSVSPWTKTDLDAAQVGINLAAASTNAAQVSNLWLLVEYSPPTLASDKMFQLFD